MSGENGVKWKTRSRCRRAETRTLAALTALIGAAGEERQPAVIMLDGCQWADDAALKLLAELGAPATGPRHVVEIAAFRSEEVSEDHRLRRLKPSCHRVLQPLKPEDVRQLIYSMARALADEVVQLVISLADGSPFKSGWRRPRAWNGSGRHATPPRSMTVS